MHANISVCSIVCHKELKADDRGGGVAASSAIFEVVSP